MTFPDEMDRKIIEINRRKEQRRKAMRELKPCPFCGGNAVIIAYSHDPDIEDWYIARCLECFAEIKCCKDKDGRIVPFTSREKAIKAWNYRAGGID